MGGSVIQTTVDLAQSELDERIFVLGEVVTNLEMECVRWSRKGVLVVSDTSFHSPRRQRRYPNLRPTLTIRGDSIHLPIPMDVIDELDDRAAAIQNLPNCPVTLITYDTGQSSRGLAAGLKVVKLVQAPEGAEP